MILILKKHFKAEDQITFIIFFIFNVLIFILYLNMITSKIPQIQKNI